MDSYCFPASELPGSSRLFSTYLSDFAKLADFYRHKPSITGARKAAKAVAIPVEKRTAVVAVLRAQNLQWADDASVTANLDRLARGACAVVTGQQVGLLGGPAYSIYKALTAIAVAQKLSRQGLRAVPVFWMASEDHDLAEVSHTDWLTSATLERLAIPAAPQASGRSVGQVPLGDSGSEILARATELLDGASFDEVAEAMRHALQPGATFATQFARLLARLFAGRGLILLDPASAELHALSSPLYRAAIVRRSAWTRALLERGKLLERRGFHAQVKVTASSTALFLQVNGRREALRQQGDKLVAGETAFTEAELLRELDEHPERFSGNAIFRAIVQDNLLPTAVFIAGPAEIAYLAQSEVLYQETRTPMPLVLPRASFTLVAPHVARLLKKYRLQLAEVFAAAPVFRKRLERDALPAGLAQRFAAGERELAAHWKKLAPALAKLDKTLLGAASNADRKMLYQLRKLREKAARAQAFRGGVIDRHEQTLRNALFPNKQPQERVLNFLPFLAHGGFSLLDKLEARAGDTGQHHVLFL